MDFFNTHISDKAISSVKDVLKSGFVSAGNIAKNFEDALERELGLINPISVNSGTSALHLGLAVANIKPGDEVILPAQTFIATGLAVLMQGATPVFADIQYDTGNIDPDSIRNKITERTKLIIAVHWGGYPCDMDEINNIANEFNILVMEDAAHALGALYKNKPIGSISNFTAFSFQAIKHLTSGDGGALCCIDNINYFKGKKKRWFGIDRENSKISELGEREFDITEVGFKYHLNDVSAAIGLGNLQNFSSQLSRIQQIAKRYRTELDNVDGLQLLNYKGDRKSAYWLFTVLVENRSDFVRKLMEFNVPTSVVNQRIDRLSVFNENNEKLSNQERFDKKQISIPIHSALTDEDVSIVISSIMKGW
tara:strand:+ start:1832 stop:2929 length:1098 start_codon:yes stop_codon:yes gene_type:complete